MLLATLATWIPQSFVDDVSCFVWSMLVESPWWGPVAKEAKRPCVICLTEKEELREMGVNSSGCRLLFLLALLSTCHMFGSYVRNIWYFFEHTHLIEISSNMGMGQHL